MRNRGTDQRKVTAYSTSPFHNHHTLTYRWSYLEMTPIGSWLGRSWAQYRQPPLKTQHGIFTDSIMFVLNMPMSNVLLLNPQPSTHNLSTSTTHQVPGIRIDEVLVEIRTVCTTENDVVFQAVCQRFVYLQDHNRLGVHLCEHMHNEEEKEGLTNAR